MGSAQVSSATVASLWRYPVKSMMGEPLNAADVLEGGFVGDRAYALIVSATGAVASAKDVKRFMSLFDCLANFAEPPKPDAALPPVRITLPDGTSVTSTDEETNRILSAVFKTQVTLASVAPPRPTIDVENPEMDGIAVPGVTSGLTIRPSTFFDAATIHLFSTSTLDGLRSHYPKGRFEARRFRPNIVMAPDSELDGFVENDWIGRTLAIGDEVRIKVTRPCQRCVMTTLPQGDLPRDLEILRTIAQYSPKIDSDGGRTFTANVGVYASVLQGGRIRRGDPVRPE